jgi:hypothetical protein
MFVQEVSLNPLVEAVGFVVHAPRGRLRVVVVPDVLRMHYQAGPEPRQWVDAVWRHQAELAVLAIKYHQMTDLEPVPLTLNTLSKVRGQVPADELHRAQQLVRRVRGLVRRQEEEDER